MRDRRFQLPLLLAIFILLFSACSQDSQTPSATPEPEVVEEAIQEVAENELALAATAWTLDSMGNPEDNVNVVEGTRPSLNFLLSTYAGSGGCNWYFGAYNLDGNDVNMGPATQTRIACESPEGVMDQEKTFIGAVSNTTSYVLENDQLKLYTVGDQLLATLSPAEPVPFEGSTWSLKFISDGQDMNPALMEVELTALFEDGEISGSSGCNTYSGSYELDDQDLTIGPLVLTMMACEDPKGVMDQESAYVLALESVAGYELVGGVMALVDSEGAPLLQYGVK
jgi:heat shock protein HslJ